MDRCGHRQIAPLGGLHSTRMGGVLWSQRVANDHAAISQLLARVAGTAAELVWAVDLTSSYVALLGRGPAGRLPARSGGQPRRGCLPQRGQDRRQGHSCDRLIADQARMRRDLVELGPSIFPTNTAKASLSPRHVFNLMTTTERPPSI